MYALSERFTGSLANLSAARTVRTMNNDVYTYNMRRAAEILGCNYFWLRDQVTNDDVPHGRWGKRKGVFFTPEHLTEIINGRQRSGRETATVKPAPENSPKSPSPLPPEFRTLRSLWSE